MRPFETLAEIDIKSRRIQQRTELCYADNLFGRHRENESVVVRRRHRVAASDAGQPQADDSRERIIGRTANQSVKNVMPRRTEDLGALVSTPVPWSPPISHAPSLRIFSRLHARGGGRD